MCRSPWLDYRWYNGQYRKKVHWSPFCGVVVAMVQRHHRGILYMVRLSVYGGWCRESFKQSDPWCRCSSDSAASRGFSYGPVADVQWLMRDSWNPPVFPVGCFPFFFVQYPLSYGEGLFSYPCWQVCRSGGRLGIAVHRQVVTTAFGASPVPKAFLWSDD